MKRYPRLVLPSLFLLLLLTASGTAVAQQSPDSPGGDDTAPPAHFDSPENGPIGFDHLTTGDGLSSSSVSAITQDEAGFMWFATQSGLNRYDGYRMERYEHDPFDRNSLSHNLIQTMYRDDQGVFWIGTYGGLNRFDPDSEEFRAYRYRGDDPRSLSDSVVVAIARDAEGTLWAGTLDGLNRLDAPEEGRFTRFRPESDGDGGVPSEVIRDITVDRKGTLWIGSYGGLSRYVPGDAGFRTVPGPSADTEADVRLPSRYVMSIVLDPENDDVLWLGTWDGGISRYNTRSGEIRTYPLPEDDVYTMMFDSTGTLWVGTWGHGLYLFDPETEDLAHITSEDGRPGRRLSHDVVYSFHEDEAGIVWVGTNGGGVDKYVPWENRFRTLVHDPDDPDSLSAGKVEAVHTDADGTVWIGVYNGGLNRYDPDTGEIRRYRHRDGVSSSLSNDIVNTIYRDSTGTLWIGTNDGLNRFLPEKDAFERIYADADDSSPPENVVFDIAEDPRGRLWLGTNTSGVAVYDRRSGRYTVFSHDPDDPRSLSDDLVRNILHDGRGNTWLATNDGLNRYDPENGEFIRYTHDTDTPGTISSNNVRALHEDRAGRLWIATAGGGVNRYHYEQDRFSFFSRSDGLASNHVIDIVEDEQGQLWFPTNHGVSLYDPGSGSFRTLNVSDGLLSNEMTQGVETGPDGLLYLGSIDGLTIIDTQELSRDPYEPPVVVTEVEVMGRSRKLERVSPARYDALELEHNESLFSLEFAALDYSSPDLNRYSYRLKGFEEDWVSAGSRNYAGYTNLDPGHYELQIRGAGSRGNWNQTGVTVPVLVRPPWWETPGVMVLYVVLGLALIGGAIARLRLSRLRAERRLEEQERITKELDAKVRERTAEIEESRKLAEEATEAKTQFLANMSHEIRTPLNGMKGMLSLLARSPLTARQREYLEHSRVSAENLETLVNDLLDFERIEAGELRITPETFYLSDVVDYMAKLFHEPAREKKLSFSVDADFGSHPGCLYGDRSRLVQVLTNLVSNAIKYTPEGWVRLEARGGGTDAESSPERLWYRFDVVDSGVGISPEYLESIFDRFRQLDHSHTKSVRGVGLGLAVAREVTEAMGGRLTVDSTVGEGSRFSVILPFVPSSPSRAGEEECRESAPGRPAPGSAVLGPSAPGSTAPRSDVDHPAETAAPTGDLHKEARPAVLVCEDEAVNRLYIRRYLADLGYAVDEARDGPEAIAKVEQGGADLVIMDVGLPDLSGLEVTRRLRASGVELPIIALTAHTYEEDIRSCYEAGMNGFVSKPIQERKLLEAIRVWVG
jgi:signal transduction histidine kinase/ligand-binding sensor domain-containing protein/CheY-like chemotaxis protein